MSDAVALFIQRGFLSAQWGYASVYPSKGLVYSRRSRNKYNSTVY